MMHIEHLVPTDWNLHYLSPRLKYRIFNVEFRMMHSEHLVLTNWIFYYLFTLWISLFSAVNEF